MRDVLTTLVTILSVTIALEYPTHVVIDGDIYIVAMLGLTGEGCIGIDHIAYQMMEAVNLALKQINKQMGVKIGAIIMDDCESEAHGLELTKAFYEGVLLVHDSTGARIDPKRVVGYVASESSDRTMKVAGYLKNTMTALVTPWATSPQLSDRTRFPYVVRTVPSDSKQGPALAALLISLGWSNVHLVIEEESSYASDLAKTFKDTFEREETGRCISSTHILKPTESNEEQILPAIMNSPSKADVVLLFVAGGDGIKRLLAAKEKYIEDEKAKRLVFIGTEAWGKSEHYIQVGGYKKAGKGSITIALYGENVKAFDTHMSELRFGQTSSLSNYTDMVFKSMFNCDTNCTTNMTITEHPTYSQDSFILATIQAVYALSIATTERLTDKCGEAAKNVCEEFGTAFGKNLTEAMENMCFKDNDGQYVAIRDRESDNSYNLFYWKEDGTPMKIGTSGSEGRSFRADPEHSNFPKGYYDVMPEFECPKRWAGYFCKRCRLGRKMKLVAKCWDCKQTKKKKVPTATLR